MFLITCGSRRGGPMLLGQCGQYIDIKLSLIFNIIIMGPNRTTRSVVLFDIYIVGVERNIISHGLRYNGLETNSFSRS